MTTTNRQAQAFGARLCELLRSRGLVSTGSKSGVDVGAFAKGCGVSYEMAWRYAEGLAMPRGNTLQAIADFLGVSPSYLTYGETAETGQTPINIELLEKCLLAVTQAQERIGKVLSPDKSAQVVAMLYAEAMEGRAPSPDLTLRLVRML